MSGANQIVKFMQRKGFTPNQALNAIDQVHAVQSSVELDQGGAEASRQEFVISGKTYRVTVEVVDV